MTHIYFCITVLFCLGLIAALTHDPYSVILAVCFHLAMMPIYYYLFA